MMRDQIGSCGGVEGPCFRCQSIAGYVHEVLRGYEFEKFGLRISLRRGRLSCCLFDGLHIFLLFRRQIDHLGLIQESFVTLGR